MTKKQKPCGRPQAEITPKGIDLLPAAVFLDTSVLEPDQQTLESAELAQLVCFAQTLGGGDVFMPDIVRREWMEHRVSEAIKFLDNAQASLKHVNQYMPNSGNISGGPKALTKAVKAASKKRISTAGLRVLEPPDATLAELTDRAVTDVPPINTGFKDELVVLAMLSLLSSNVDRSSRRCRYRSAILIAKDGHYNHNHLPERFTDYKVRFILFPSIAKANSWLDGCFTDARRKILSLRKDAALEAAKAKWAEISDTVREAIERQGISISTLRRSDRGDITRIVAVRPVQIREVSAVAEASVSAECPITIIVDVEIDVEVQERFGILQLVRRKLLLSRIGMEGRIEPPSSPTPPLPSGGLAIITQIVPVSVETVGKMTETNQCEDLRVTSVRL
jgi:hypothetical protein